MTVQYLLEQLFLECEHGDAEHRQWLKNKFNDFASRAPQKNCVLIAKDYLEELHDNANKLYHLEAGGVDNWEWYGEALEPYWRAKGEYDEEDEE